MSVKTGPSGRHAKRSLTDARRDSPTRKLPRPDRNASHPDRKPPPPERRPKSVARNTTSLAHNSPRLHARQRVLWPQGKTRRAQAEKCCAWPGARRAQRFWIACKACDVANARLFALRATDGASGLVRREPPPAFTGLRATQFGGSPELLVLRAEQKHRARHGSVHVSWWRPLPGLAPSTQCRSVVGRIDAVASAECDVATIQCSKPAGHGDRNDMRRVFNSEAGQPLRTFRPTAIRSA